MLISHLFMLVVFVLRTGVRQRQNSNSLLGTIACYVKIIIAHLKHDMCFVSDIGFDIQNFFPPSPRFVSSRFVIATFRFLLRDPRCDISAYCVLNFELLLLHNSYWIVKKPTFIYVPLDCRELCLRNEHDLRECSVMVNLVLYFFYEIVLINPKGLRNFKRFA